MPVHHSASQITSKALLILFLSVAVALANARPSHFIGGGEMTGGGAPADVVDPDNNNLLLESGLKPWQLELIAQRLAEISGGGGGGKQQQAAAMGGMDYGSWEQRGVRSPENKRQSRYRQCYFNPISCFRK